MKTIIDLLVKNEILVKSITELSNETITEYLLLDTNYFLKAYHSEFGDYLDIVTIEELNNQYNAVVVVPDTAEYNFENEIILNSENLLILKKFDINSLK